VRQRNRDERLAPGGLKRAPSAAADAPKHIGQEAGPTKNFGREGWGRSAKGLERFRAGFERLFSGFGR
jgi:hypothetical protein